MIAVIILRDIVITLFRYIFIKYKDFSMKTSFYGKIKTLSQIIIIHIILLFLELWIKFYQILCKDTFQSNWSNIFLQPH